MAPRRRGTRSEPVEELDQRSGGQGWLAEDERCLSECNWVRRTEDEAWARRSAAQRHSRYGRLQPHPLGLLSHSSQQIVAHPYVQPDSEPRTSGIRETVGTEECLEALHLAIRLNKKLIISFSSYFLIFIFNKERKQEG